MSHMDGCRKIHDRCDCDGLELTEDLKELRAERDTARAERDTARAEVESLRDNYGAELSRALRRIENAEAEAESRKAEVDDLKAQLAEALGHLTESRTKHGLTEAQLDVARDVNAKVSAGMATRLAEALSLKAQLAAVHAELREVDQHLRAQLAKSEALVMLRDISLKQTNARALDAEEQLRVAREALEREIASHCSDPDALCARCERLAALSAATPKAEPPECGRLPGEALSWPACAGCAKAEPSRAALMRVAAAGWWAGWNADHAQAADHQKRADVAAIVAEVKR